MAIDTLRLKEPNVDADGKALASGGETPASTRGADLHQQVQHLADGPLSPDGLGQGQVPVNLVGVTTTVPVLYDVARLGQVGDDGVGAAFGATGDGGSQRGIRRPMSEYLLVKGFVRRAWRSVR